MVREILRDTLVNRAPNPREKAINARDLAAQVERAVPILRGVDLEKLRARNEAEAAAEAEAPPEAGSAARQPVLAQNRKLKIEL